ncbi:MAG TPA: hypothetical protein VFF42_02250, partial [Candidatus Eremiobacteraceae bacterium]|nr:hypothetical protein [Candidatus Eremiobacteraceae bacterium]
MKRFCIWSQLVLICLFAGVAGYAQAQDSPSRSLPVNATPQQAPVVPQLIKFTGTLFDQHAQPVESPVGVTFALYSQQFGGAALWLETQNVEIDAKGNYTALIGANTSHGVPAELFTSGEARWLGVQSERQPEQPRALLVSVPYALKAGDAETLGGKPASAFALLNATTPINQTVVVGVVSANAQSPTPLATGTLAVTTA